MNKAATGIAITIACIAVVAGGAYLLHRHTAAQSTAAPDDSGGAEVKPIASVTIAPIVSGSMSAHLTVFGSIVARPEFTRLISVPYESQASRINVSVGERVAKQQPILQVRPSLAAKAVLEDARNTVAASEKDLALVQQRYDQKLATSSELFTAQNAVRTAKTRLAGLSQTDPTQPQDLTSDVDAVITKIDVQPGQIAAAGAPLVEMVPRDRIQARLAVDTSIIRDLKVGQPVELATQNGTRPIIATIASVTNRVDPATHLADVYLQMPTNNLPLDTQLVATLSISHGDGFLVPHDAVVPDEDGNYELFTVKSDKAVKHTVQVMAEDDAQTQISGSDLSAGDLIVIAGNYVLEDGMSVKAERSTAPVTKPSSQPSRPEPGDEK